MSAPLFFEIRNERLAVALRATLNEYLCRARRGTHGRCHGVG